MNQAFSMSIFSVKLRSKYRSSAKKLNTTVEWSYKTETSLQRNAHSCLEKGSLNSRELTDTQVW